jgi:hypothetical protein
MGAQDPTTGGVLELIECPGVVALLVTMHGRDEPATVGQLQAVVGQDAAGACATQILRTLAIAGFIRCSGSLDESELGPVSLTAAGQGLANTLLKLDEWSRTRLGNERRRPGRTVS